jgi:hypothetical protein
LNSIGFDLADFVITGINFYKEFSNKNNWGNNSYLLKCGNEAVFLSVIV